MIPNNKLLNSVVNRFLPIPESVLKGLEPEPKITDFTLIRELGVGSFGRVLLVQHNKTQAQYAIKAIDKRNATNIQERPYFRREIEIMYRIHHPNVVKLFGHFEDNTLCSKKWNQNNFNSASRINNKRCDLCNLFPS